jgi:hypothetical protein
LPAGRISLTISCPAYAHVRVADWRRAGIVTLRPMNPSISHSCGLAAGGIDYTADIANSRGGADWRRAGIDYISHLDLNAGARCGWRGGIDYTNDLTPGRRRVSLAAAGIDYM